MQREERVKMIKAMDYIARRGEGKHSYNIWFNAGVADYDIENDDLEKYYEDDREFADLMDTFLVFTHNNKLACDGVVSEPLAMGDLVSADDFNKEDFLKLLDAMIEIDEICSKKCMERPLYNIHSHDNFVGSISALKRVKRLLTDPQYYDGMKKLYL